MEKDTRTKIKEVTVDLISTQGIKGTSIRELSKKAGCSLPMMYYYFENKEKLLEEVVFEDFKKLRDRLSSCLDITLPLSDIYAKTIKQLTELNEYEKKIYSLVLRLWLGFEEVGSLRTKLLEWERQRFENALKLFEYKGFDTEKSRVVAGIVVKLTEDAMIRYLLLGEEVDITKFRQELEAVIGLL